MPRVAVLILNRNLPDLTNNLYSHIEEFEKKFVDIFILEAGSDKKNLSNNFSWHISDPLTKKNGLRYSKGMNLALLKIFESGEFDNYDAFFLLNNDVQLPKYSVLERMLKILDDVPKIGILSPCSNLWGEKNYLIDEKTKFFWYIQNNAFLLRKEFIQSAMNRSPTMMNFLFDGNNFRGYLAESELIAKAYINGWGAAITAEVFIERDFSFLMKQSSLIKTDPFNKNSRLMLEEGFDWLKTKYGFNSKWDMHFYVKNFYDLFFQSNPNLLKYRL
jgi:GT2 family glycosyltransferase